MTKSERMSKHEIRITEFDRGWFIKSFAPDLVEDQVQFFGFLPEIARLGFQARFCGGHHPQEELGFASLLAAGANLVFEILSRDPVVSFAIIRTHTRASSNQLFDQTVI